MLLFNPYPSRSPDAIAVPTAKHMETLQIRPRQKPKKQQLVLGKISKPNSTQSRREKRKQKKGAELTNLYVLAREAEGRTEQIKAAARVSG